MPTGGSAETSYPRGAAAGARWPLFARDVQLYRLCEDFSEGLIYLMVVFSPWAFGTTQAWSIAVMNGAGYCLGILLGVKLGIRRFKGYRPPRWGEAAAPEFTTKTILTESRLTVVLATLTVALLVYCLISAVNAYATFHRSELSFAYHACLPWLPHSFDSELTWPAFWNYLGLAGAFWAVRDWLLGKSGDELKVGVRRPGAADPGTGALFPTRLRRLLWVLAINGGILGLEGITQRLEGSGKLLFLVRPRVNIDAASQFGPYAYRANAASYFNLLWPVTVGFWWLLHRTCGLRRHAHHLVLVCGLIMAACPIVSTSRGGALVAVGILTLAVVFLVGTHFLFAPQRNEDRRSRTLALVLTLLFFTGTLALGVTLGWKALKPRLAQINDGFDGREEMSDRARPMAADYPIYGTGPGTFETVFQLYRISTDTYWPAQLHNDWLETRITFGLAGSSLIGLALATVWLRWFARGGIHGGRRFVILLWLALAGCLAHARFDFPFQIHSILFLFLLLCAILFSLARRP